MTILRWKATMMLIKMQRMALSLLILLCSIWLGGCGVIWDAGVKVASYSPSPEPLYTAEFYKTATPAEVKQAMGNTSLKGKFYQEKAYDKSKSSFLFDETETSIITVFIPGSRVWQAEPEYPLKLALYHSPYPEVITLLLDAGAELPPSFAEPICWRCMQPAAVKEVLVRQNNRPYLHCMALQGYSKLANLEMVQYIVGLDASLITCHVVNASSVLTEAVKEGHIAIVNYFLNQGADIEHRDLFNETPLSYALLNNHVDIAYLLIKRGASLTTVHQDAFDDKVPPDTLLTFAQRGNVQDNNLLMQLAAHVPTNGGTGRSALIAACLLDNPPLVNRLQARGAKFATGENCQSIKLHHQPK